MPPKGRRARLQADILVAKEQDIAHIRVTGKGDAQDEFSFTFTHPQVTDGNVKLYAMPQNEGDYPIDHYFLVYTNDEASSDIRNVLDMAMTSTRGMLIVDFLKTLSRLLCEALESPETDGEHIDNQMIGAEDDLDPLSDPDDSDSDIPFDYGDADDYDDLSEHPSIGLTPVPDATLQRIRQDLRAVKHAGFKVGKIYGIDHISEYSIMTMSVKVSKLCLSEETRTAWSIQASDYLVLLIKYSGNYIPFESALEMPIEQIPYEFRLRRCSKYRPTQAQAIAAFSTPSRKRGFGQFEEKPIKVENSTPFWCEFGVGGSIELLLQNFIAMMKIRKNRNTSWDNAKWIQTQLNSQARDEDEASLKIPNLDTDATSIADANLPPILIDDHLSSERSISLPLVAIQFSLRYIVKCTEYCMICHERTGHSFEALKPYVCGNPLCLFQYMSVGLGPSIDHEIINQEYVVDLLISFCYASLIGSHGHAFPRIREFPAGLNLQVPCVREPTHPQRKGDIVIVGHAVLIDPREVKIIWSDSRVIIIDEARSCDPALVVGRWVIIHIHHDKDPYNESRPCECSLDIFHYARIEEKSGASLRLNIASRYPVPPSPRAYKLIERWNWDTGYSSGQLVLCNQSLDVLEKPESKAFSLILLLAALPPVTEMRAYLMTDQSRRLATWNRIPLESMKLLRWIVASNRSFIVQLDNSVESDVGPREKEDNRPDRSEEKILGLDGWIQFRFAQGSPEKEVLFFDALDKVQKPQRTILAWHGSGLGNWHSILREGLNFNVVTNGRAYGEGCYFSRSWDYSVAYSSIARHTEQLCWPQSSLQITTAISLNELVNLPEKFKHSQACYVVDILHWIQCRYLFVRTTGPVQTHESEAQAQRPRGVEFKQDPQYAILGPGSKKVFVPEIAIPSIRRVQRCEASASSGLGDVKDNDTDEEDIEDIEFLMLPRALEQQQSETDFRPGTLDFSNLPQLALPSYASGPAQRIIQRELQKLEKVQSETPLHELGWYMDFGRIENMFQWIVELHSFDPSLPLAQDMKTAGITSIVLEIRFLAQFPVTPPFVRVVKPRFLPFSMGGGGHVTAGGFMCMELLTTTGWSPANSMESVFLQVRVAMCNTEPVPARLNKPTHGLNEYGIGEAVEAAVRAFRVHNWEIPADFRFIS